MLTDAILYAAEQHRGQARKDSELPYIVHPLEVMDILIRHGVRDQATLAAAVLHDVVEDCREKGVTAAAVKERFGPVVAEIVAALTKPDGPDWKAVKKQALEQVRRGPAAARIVKMADRLSNLRDLDALGWEPARKDRYRTEAEEIARIGRDDLPALSDELLRAVAAQRAGDGPAGS